MLADMYGCEVRTSKAQEGPALGVAILAGVGAGIFKDVPTACRQFITPDSSCLPEAAAHAYYVQGHRLYQRLYNQLKDCYTDLASL